MKILGLQKMTLLDYPGKVACTVFLGGCDLRCPFCHNAELLSGAMPPVLDDQGLLAFLDRRKGLLDGVCVTGGEPLLHDELPSLLRSLREKGFLVKLDTNGTHPDRLRAVMGEGLVDYVAMDVKNSPERYAETVGRPAFDLAPIRESVALLLGGAVEYEFRTTVVREFHDDASFTAIGPWLAGARRYFLQPFVDRETVPRRGLNPPSEADLARFLGIVREWIPAADTRGV